MPPRFRANVKSREELTNDIVSGFYSTIAERDRMEGELARLQENSEELIKVLQGLKAEEATVRNDIEQRLRRKGQFAKRLHACESAYRRDIHHYERGIKLANDKTKTLREEMEALRVTYQKRTCLTTVVIVVLLFMLVR